MSEPRRKSRSRRGGQPQPKRTALDLWRATSPMPPVERIAPASDPTAMLRSLGNPPLQGEVSGHYLAAVIARAADLATGLAAAGGALATEDGPTA